MKLLAAVSITQGVVPVGHKAADYWAAYIRCGWDTGLRCCDLVRIKAADVTPDGFLTITQQKTGQSITCRLHPSTIEALAKLGEHGLAWGRPDRRETSFYRHFNAVIARAGLTGKPKWIRRSSATAVELQAPGTAGRHLGHSTPGIAERHYLDPRILAKSQQPPPPLEM